MDNIEIKRYKEKITWNLDEINRNKIELNLYLKQFLKKRYGATNINITITGFDFTIKLQKNLLLFLNDLKLADISLTYWKGGRISIVDRSDLIKIINTI